MTTRLRLLSRPVAPREDRTGRRGRCKTAFQQAVALAKHDKAALNSVYILLAVTDAERGTPVRALRHLGVDSTLLCDCTRRLLDRGPVSDHSDRSH